MNKRKRKVCLALALACSMTLAGIWPVCGVEGYAAADIQGQEAEWSSTESIMHAEGTNAFGVKVAEAVNEEIAERTDSNYWISEVTVSGRTASVSYMAVDNAQLVLAIYNDEGTQMLGSDTVALDPSVQETQLQLSIAEIPDSFLLKAFLLDPETHRPLGKAYVNKKYTKNFQEFLAKTVDDFPEEQVVNLDESSQTNFVVFREGTITATQTDATNRLTVKADGVYVIENAEAAIQNLKSGDVLSLVVDNDLKILKVAACRAEGNTVTLTEADAELEELFSYIKVEADCNDSQIDPDLEGLDESVTYLGSRTGESEIQPLLDEETGFGNTWHCFKFDSEKSKDSKHLSVEGTANASIDFGITGTIEVYYSPPLDLSVSFTITPSLNIDFKLEGEITGKIPLVKLVYPIVTGINMTFTPSIIVRAAGSFDTTFTVTMPFGFGFDTEEGFSKKKVEPECNSEMKLEGSLFMGLSAEPAIEILGEVAEIELTAEAGVEITGKMGIANPGKDQKHLCAACVSGDISLKREVSVNITVLDGLLEKDWTIAKGSQPLAEYYYSFDKGSGDMELIWNKKKKEPLSCPNCSYKVETTVTDASGAALGDVLIYCEGDWLGRTNPSGKQSFYLRKGWHVLKLIDPDGKGVTRKSVNVKEEKNSISIAAVWQPDNYPAFDKTAHGAVVRSGDCDVDGRGGVQYIFYEDGTLYCYGGNGVLDYRDGRGNIWLTEKWTKEIKNVFLEQGVSEIGRAFNGCSSLTSITIPDSVTSIGGFSGCSSLTSITIPNSVTSIENGAFSGCSSLTDITIPNSVTSIWDGAFNGCSNLTSITIPDSVTYIGWDTFSGCSSLTSITIPNSVTSIGNGVFNGCSNLTSITIPDSVTDIGKDAFNGCSSLTGIAIPNSVTGIGDGAFNGCSNLTSITIPDSVTYIGWDAFNGCSSLTSITIPDSVTDIRQGAFEGCSSLTSIFIPNSVTSIGKWAFSKCSSLTDITIPDSVTNIGVSAFSECSSLTIHASSGSYAERYAKDNTIPFVASESSSVQTLETGLQAFDVVPDTSMAFSDAAAQEAVIHTASYSTAVKDKEYLLLVVRDEYADNLLSTDNLLYIDQKTAMADGTLTFDYLLEDVSSYKEILLEEADNSSEPTPPLESEAPSSTKPSEAPSSAKPSEASSSTKPSEAPSGAKPSEAPSSAKPSEAPSSANPGESSKPGETVTGDLNGDGKITLKDAQITLKAALNLLELDNGQKQAADVNGDSKVNLADAQLILKKSLNLIDTWK